MSEPAAGAPNAKPGGTPGETRSPAPTAQPVTSRASTGGPILATYAPGEAGMTLDAYLHALTETGQLPDEDDVARIGRELAAALNGLHSDETSLPCLTPANVVLSEGGRIVAIDVEPSRLRHVGAVDRAGEVASVESLLLLLATGAHTLPVQLDPALARGHLQLLNPELGPAMIDVIERSLTIDPARRFACLEDLAIALREAARADRRSSPEASITALSDEVAAREHARKQARRLGDTLCAVSQGDGNLSDRAGTTTLNRAATVTPGLDAGIVLALTELVQELGEPSHQAALAGAAHRLRTTAPNGCGPTSGFYDSDGLVCVALLRAGLVLHDQPLLAAAADGAERIARRPYGPPDLFSGTAGRMRLHLLLHAETNDSRHLEHAIDAGEVLVRSAQGTVNGGLAWAEGGSGTLLTGYARGAAGIGDALLDLIEMSSDERFLESARSGAVAGRSGATDPRGRERARVAGHRHRTGSGWNVARWRGGHLPVLPARRPARPPSRCRFHRPRRGSHRRGGWPLRWTHPV